MLTCTHVPVFLSHLKRKIKSNMSTCNQISGTATKIMMIRRMKSRKNISSSIGKVQSGSSVGHQTNALLQVTPTETVTEVPRFMNTYRLESKNSFNCTLVQNVLQEIVNKHCSGFKYDPILSVSKVKLIAGEIMKRVKNFQFDRYRFIVYVQIGENSGQEFETAVQFLWDSTKDKFTCYNLKTSSMFTTVTCFGVYQD